MFPFLMLSVLLLGTCLANPLVGMNDIIDELNRIKEDVNNLNKRVTEFGNNFYTVHHARSFATGSEKLYTTNEQEGNFEEASATCTQAGGHIPSPKKEGEWKALQKVLERHNTCTFIAGQDLENSENWAPGEPNNADGTKNCVTMDKDGKWHAASCEEKHLFVCQFSFDP
ncbi:phospholipase A2 inhibitor alpha-like protein [Anolis sagrei]|uniref:phospholipase A2 inhibitor alpha-like protein n=1 Tax=Anolis sagrei TaxID=38937 RepID=UPI00352209EA